MSPFRFRILAMGLAGGDRAVQAIIRHAGDQDAHREEVALAAGLAGGKEALAPVKRGLSKEQPELAVAGAAFLGGEAGVELLTDALRCKNVEARRAALTGLGWTGGGKTARDVLTKALNDADESIAAGALRNLGIALGLDALPQLEKCAADAIKRSTALDALGDVGGEPAVRIVEALAAKNPGRMEPSLAYSCFLAVRRAGLGREADNRALAILSRAPEQFGGNDPSYIARIKSLGPGQASADQVVAFAEMALTARNPVVVVPGFLAAVRDDRAQTMLIKAMAHRDDYVFCDLSAQMLARSCGDRAIPLLEKALTSRDRWAPSAAIKALGHIGGRRAFELLEKQNSNREALIRISTILALKEVGGPEAQRLLLAMARTESDPDRRRVIRNSLADDEGRKAFDALPAPVSR